MEEKKTYGSIDAYIADCPAEYRPVLQALREAILAEAPAAGQKISWGMPTFTLGGNLIHFALHKHHVGVYPGAECMAAFEKELAGYKTSKGAVQFPLAQALPYALVRRMVAYNVAQLAQGG